MANPFNSIQDAIKDIRKGKCIILVDDEDRENEGDLVIAADKVTPQAINFMAKHARGLICLALTPERCEELQLPPQAIENTATFGTAFTVSVDARKGITTGISAADRSTTIQVALDPKAKPSDLARPGHIFPLKAQKGGVLKRAGQTEGSVDLARLAGLQPAGVICEIMNEDGSMARVPELARFAKKHKLKMVTIKALIEYRMQRETFVKRAATARMPTIFGDFEAVAFENEVDNVTHIALVKGKVDGGTPTLVRVHRQDTLADVIGVLSGAGATIVVRTFGPDLHVLRRQAEDEKKPIPNVISVDRARDAISFFSSTAGVGGYRVLIVDSADHLNHNSANALLKAIEEPPKQAVIFIVAHMIGRLLPTIRSRCRVLPFRPLEPFDIEQILANASAAGQAPDAHSLQLAVENARGSARRGFQWLDERFASVSSHVSMLLAQLPDYDRKEVLAMSEAFGRKEGRNDFETMRETVLDWLSAQVHARATEGAHRLAPLAEVWEKTEQAIREAERYNLDRRALALNMFNDLAAATRSLKAV